MMENLFYVYRLNYASLIAKLLKFSWLIDAIFVDLSVRMYISVGGCGQGGCSPPQVEQKSVSLGQNF